MKENKHYVITLCGSTKFESEFIEIAQELTLKGNVVLCPVIFTHRDSVGITDDKKKILDSIYQKKIDMADEIIIINKNGYIGDSTMKEIEYSIRNNKKIYYLYNCSSEDKYKLPIYRKYALTDEFYTDCDK